MPTGYTEVLERQDLGLKDFVLRCARACGVSISLRGKPLDDGMPEKIEMDSFYPDSLATNRLALENLERMTLEEAKLLAQKEYEQQEQDYLEDLERRTILKSRCNKLLEQTEQWEPPTKKHVDLKKYVIEQLQTTLKYDCELRERKHKKLTARQYLLKEKKEVKEYIKHLEKRYARSKKRNEKDNQWLSDLRASLEKFNEKVA
ncbi:hypothetical protein [Cysteiniphilum marinum]|uniref:hypothetical protein n=1 Tax=Cysteiniphilum marinum TaxID=2774191 RepID=UPI00193947F3|nr:hypothetical protein [Cysteiniphilum marinum]